MTSRHKIVLIGDIGVGKTALIRRFVHDTFDGVYSGTFGFDIYEKTITVVGRQVDLLIWDTDGSTGAGLFVAGSYLEGASGALIVCDLSRPQTCDVAIDLAKDFARRLPGREACLLLNKSDLVDEPRPLAGFAAAGLSVRLTSAKSGHNVDAAFTELAASMERRGL